MKVKRRITASLFVLAAMPRFVLAAQNPPERPAPQPKPAERTVLDTTWLQDRDEGQTTADELLRALRRKRPIYDLIQPLGGRSESDRAASRMLLPEGASIVGRSGWLKRDGDWWTFEFDPAEGPRAIKLLPNVNLETLVRTVRGSTIPVKFVLSGEVTSFRGENFVIARGVSRFVPPARSEGLPESGADGRSPGKPESQPKQLGTEMHAPARGGAAADTAAGADKPPSGASLAAGTQVEDVLSALRNREPETPLPIAPPPAELMPEHRAAASLTLMADGTPLVRRPGRLVHEGLWWTFVFESDHPERPEPPIKLLPSQGVERMTKTAERESNGLVFLLSGEVTLFEDENYLLPRMVIRRIDAGNLTK